MKHLITDFFKRNRSLILTAIFLAPFYLTFGCPLRFFAGICCPGCGMSRAVEALLHFDFQEAYFMHPLVFLLPVAAAVYFLRHRIPKKLLALLCVVALLLMLTVYIIRLTQGSEIVFIDFEKGLFYRLFHKMIN